MFSEIVNSITVENIKCPSWMHKILIGENGLQLRDLGENIEKVITYLLFISCIF